MIVAEPLRPVSVAIGIDPAEIDKAIFEALAGHTFAPDGSPSPSGRIFSDAEVSAARAVLQSRIGYELGRRLKSWEVGEVFGVVSGPGGQKIDIGRGWWAMPGEMYDLFLHAATGDAVHPTAADRS
jgi:hypothetical protein